MEIKILSENTSVNADIGCEFGLGIYVRANGKHILFDTGSGAVFEKNAAALGVDLSKVDFAVLSHGHSDHGGGLERFFELNKSAKVYAGKGVTGDFYAKRPDKTFNYIGLSESAKANGRLFMVDKLFKIDDNTYIFASTGDEFLPSGNSTLYSISGDNYILDDFSHERHLALEEKGKSLLIVGCGHGGIVNILKTYHGHFGKYPDFVLGGFHMYNAGIKVSEDAVAVQKTGEFLKSTGATFYTGHCTGEEAFLILKKLLGEKIQAFHAGTEITLV